jgi:endonuclease/exonuclease/phosphatase family metal-dependent hydrolase
VVDGPALRVVSFNLRNARAFDGWNSWWFRRRATATVLAELDPDVAGLQEAYRIQERYLLQALPRYSSVGEGRDGGRRGERSPVLYRTGAFRLVTGRTHWYGDPDDRPGRLPGASFPRIATVAELEHEVTGLRFGVVNTHLDQREEANRVRSVEQLLGWLRPGLPWLVVGDLNARPDEPAVRLLEAAGLRSVVPLEEGGTTHQWKGGTGGRRLDYVLVDDGWEVLGAGVDHTRPGGRLPSDHWPVWADVRLRG